MPYRSNPGRPGRRITWRHVGLLGNNAVPIIETRKPRTAQSYGRAVEKQAADELRKAGWTVTESHLSRGSADLAAVRLEPGSTVALTMLVQVKSCQQFRPTAFNKGCREILTAPPVQRRCVFGYLYGRGHIVTITFDHAGQFSVTGKEPYVSEVKLAVTHLLDASSKRLYTQKQQPTRGTTRGKS